MIRTVDQLEKQLAQPSAALVEMIRTLAGDILVLGVGGKMGPSLAKLAQEAIVHAGVEKRVIGVSRFSTRALRQDLEKAGIETIAADLLDPRQVDALPECANVIYMVGQKFGTTGKEYLTWAMNTYVPGLIGARFRDSRIVAFSSGNIYPFRPVTQGGATEETDPSPVGEYAQSCLGRERLFAYFGQAHGTRILQFRLNYAIDLRYGVLLDTALAVQKQQPIDVTMGSVNVIWQGDANDYALRCLPLCQAPAAILNVTGPETISVRWLAWEFAKRLGVKPVFHGVEGETALLSNASAAHRRFGYPRVTLDQMIEWTVDWVTNGGEILGKPTQYQQREGRF